jgi:hypothetical protein
MGERRHAQANGIQAAWQSVFVEEDRRAGAQSVRRPQQAHQSRDNYHNLPRKANPAIRARSANPRYQSCHPAGVREQARKRPAIRAATNCPFRASFSRP